MKDPHYTDYANYGFQKGALPSGKGNLSPGKDLFRRFDVIGPKTKSA